MAQVSQRLRNSFSGALAGGGDPASSPLYVFGPFLRFLALAGVSKVTFGASVWLVVLTVAVVSMMYRQVIRWVPDGTGGSGLTEEEFGAWAVKVNSSITFVEYTLTFLVSVAALITLIADRLRLLDQDFHGFKFRTISAVVLSLSIGWVVNRGPKAAARTFGPATFGVLLLLWVMIAATIWRLGLHLPDFNLQAFSPKYLRFTLSGFSRLLALMTGIEVFANLVAAYEGTPAQRSRKAFRSLLIAMGTTCATMLIVGPAIFQLADLKDTRVSVFTQAMDRILPSPLPYLGTLVGIVVLGSAAAASAQGLQNLALGLRYRHYVPARMGQRNEFDVADLPVWIEVAIVCVCFVSFGVDPDTYLALYAVGVFVLLSMTGWAAAQRTLRLLGHRISAAQLLLFSGTIAAAILTSAATGIIFFERFTQGAWAYLLLIPAIYLGLSFVRSRLGEPVPLSEHLGLIYSGQYLLPYRRQGRSESETVIQQILVPLGNTLNSEAAISAAEFLAHTFSSRLTLLSVDRSMQAYLQGEAAGIAKTGIGVDYAVEQGKLDRAIVGIAKDMEADLIVMTARGQTSVERLLMGDVTERILRSAPVPVILIPRQGERAWHNSFKKVLVALDGSRTAEVTLRFARMFAQTFGSELLLLAVPESDRETPQLEIYVQEVAQAIRERGMNCRASVTGSGAARTISDTSESENCDLVIVAKSGRGGSHRRGELGSVVIRAIQTVHCPIMLVQHEVPGSNSTPPMHLL